MHKIFNRTYCEPRLGTTLVDEVLNLIDARTGLLPRFFTVEMIESKKFQFLPVKLLAQPKKKKNSKDDTLKKDGK